MSPRRLRLAVLLVVMPSGLAAAGGAQACLTAPRTIVRTVITNADGSQVPAEEVRRIEAARKSEELRADVVSGRIDTASGLADLLVPNVRDDGHGCGAEDDGPRLSYVQMAVAAFAGTELEGINPRDVDKLSASFIRNLAWRNRECGDAVRARFAGRLRGTVPQDVRGDAYVLLSEARGEVRLRYYRFAKADIGRLGQPVLDDHFDAPVARALLGDRDNPVVAALAAFWDETRPLLGDTAQLCPAAHAEMAAAREAELQRLRQRPFYADLLKAAEAGRKARGTQPTFQTPSDSQS